MEEKKGNRKSCRCNRCVRACEQKPGWFAPGEAEKVAKHLGVSLKKLFETKLGVDYWVGAEEGESENVYVLAPAIEEMTPGTEYPFDPRGRCVFLTDEGRCSIHAVKPRECREMLHDDSKSTFEDRKKSIVESWRPKQAQIEKLLGRRPEAEEGGFFGGLSLLFPKFLLFLLLFWPTTALAQLACPDTPNGEAPCIRFTCEVKVDRADKVIARQYRQIVRYQRLVRRLRAKVRGKK